MLLARRKGQDKTAEAVGVDRLANKPPRHLPQKLLLGRDDAAEGAAVAEGDAERLRLHADNVGLDGRTNDAERNRFRNGHNKQRALRVGDGGNGGNVFNDAEKVRALDQDGGRFRVISDQRRGQALVLGVGGQNFPVLGMDGAGDDGFVAPGDADGHHHGFRCSGRSVVHAGVRHVHAGELGNHGLELEDGLQRALRNFRLVGRVAGKELAALDE